MKTTSRFVILLSLLTLFISVSHALECDNPRTPYDQTYCQAKFLIQSDDELNETYSRVIDSLTKDQRNRLIAEQRRWITLRNKTCFRRGNIDLTCNIRMNKDRIQELNGKKRNVPYFTSSRPHSLIKPRRQDIHDCGYRNTYPREGWYDAQGQGVANDYCRYVGDYPQGVGSPGNWFSCVLAGTTDEYSNKEQFTDTADWIDSYEPLHPGDFCFKN